MENLNLLKLTPKQNTLFHQLKSRSFKLTGQKLRPLFKIRKSASVTANLSSDKHEKKPLNGWLAGLEREVDANYDYFNY